MQSLWSRAGQAHRCGCRTCSTAVDALGKRATATARRKPTFVEVFTACYSSVFATAALVDAVRKDERRKELDRQLEEARRELADLQERRRTGGRHGRDDDSKPPDLNVQQMDALWRNLKMIYKNRPFMKEIDKPATIRASDLVETLKREHYGCPSDASFSAARRMNYKLLECAIIEEESDKRIYYREPLNQTQLMKESRSTVQLVRQLLRRADFLAQTSPCPSLNEARGMLDGGFPAFTFRSMNPRQARDNTALLNRRLRSLIGASHLSMRERIGRVCYNLLISAYPPDMHTYNALIVAFDKSGHHAFADAFVSSFFHDRLLQPTPSTFVAILNHYQCTHNHGKFLHALSCLTGLDAKTGGKIRRRHVVDVNGSPILRLWAADTRRRTRTGNWVWEHVPLHQPLVEKIISGLLHFKLFEQAASFFISCMRSGVDLSMKLITHVLDECINALDWRAAVRLVRGITNSQAKWHAMLMAGDHKSSSYVAGRIHVLLDICGLNRPDEALARSLLQNLHISDTKLARFLQALKDKSPLQQRLSEFEDDTGGSKSRVLQIESLWKEYVFVRKTTASIESKLLYPDSSPKFRVSMALHIGGAATQRSLQLSRDFTAYSKDRHGPTSQLFLGECQEFERNVLDGELEGDGKYFADFGAISGHNGREQIHEEGQEPTAQASAAPLPAPGITGLREAC